MSRKIILKKLPPLLGNEVRHPFQFSGSGSEFFRIWIVNVLLTILTLGIYSAWAKVRTQQYIHRNTLLAGAAFDYHASPIVILKGRIIVFLLVLALQASSAESTLYLAALSIFALVMPWLLLRSLRFRLTNASYRGLRFSFTGKDAGAYQVFLLWPLLASIVFFAWPLAHHRLKCFQHNHSRYGTGAFSFYAPETAFYGVYLRSAGLFILGLALWGGALTVFYYLGHTSLSAWTPESDNEKKGMVILVTFFLMMSLYPLWKIVGAYFAARMQNLVWGYTRLRSESGMLGFVSTVRARRLVFITLTNILGIVLTLGLFQPFARIRLIKYKLSCLALLAEADLDVFAAAQTEETGGTGEAASDWYDIDIAL